MSKPALNTVSHNGARSPLLGILSVTAPETQRTVHLNTSVDPTGPPRLSAEARRRLNAMIVVVACWQIALATLTMVAVFASWPLVASTKGSTVSVVWFGPDFTLTATSGALLLGLIGGVGGSLVHTVTIFSSRVGRDTLETSYLWWYLMRPFAAGPLALLFVAAVHSGLLAASNATDDPSPMVAFVAGGLAGLFTDAVLQRLRGLLGATSTEKPASTQVLPLAARPTETEPKT